MHVRVHSSTAFGERIPYKTRAERAAERAAAGEAPDATTPASPANKTFTPSYLSPTNNGGGSQVGMYATRFTARTSSATAPATGGPRPSVSYLGKSDLPAGRPGFAGTTLAKAQAEKEAKRLEAQRNMEKIMAERYQEDRKRREEERLKKEADRKAKLDAQAGQFTEPEWKKNLKPVSARK